jgi:glucokinase
MGKKDKKAAKNQKIVGFDLGGTKMLVGLLDQDFNVLASEKRKTRGKKEEVGVFDRMVSLIQKLLDKNDLTSDNLLGIGIGAPGPLNPFTGVIGETPNLEWSNFPLRDKMEKAFGVPVTTTNDVDTGTYGEFHFGAAKGATTVLGCFPGTGIGGAVILDGKLHFGATGMTGEFGHLSLDPNGLRCGCGQRGCVEASASRLAIAANAWIAVMRGDAPNLKSEAGTDPTNYRSGALARAIQDGDSIIEEIVVEAARQIGRVIVGHVNMLSPDCVVLGGGLVEAMPEIFLGEIDKMIHSASFREISAAVKVVEASLGDDAVMMGAAKFVSDSVS